MTSVDLPVVQFNPKQHGFIRGSLHFCVASNITNGMIHILEYSSIKTLLFWIMYTELTYYIYICVHENILRHVYMYVYVLKYIYIYIINYMCKYIPNGTYPCVCSFISMWRSVCWWSGDAGDGAKAVPQGAKFVAVCGGSFNREMCIYKVEPPTYLSWCK